MLVERPSPRWSSTGLTPFLGRPGQCGYLYATPTAERLATTYDLTCNKPHTRRIFSGSRFRTLRPQSRDLTTRPPRLPTYFQRKEKMTGGCLFQTAAGIKGVGLLYSRDSFPIFKFSFVTSVVTLYL
ncbi:hypothetical protein AVEN_35958-1 [Araneus ventricosus]|uniref:Uncharacterized protein n=1 Tax=Araneus ventricosus TaxID=182803 RepID=A0A4Y2M9P5_ARAVE|nr:hypothetical protein AVEN_35958-1 [Araneus ventricosus]